MKIELQLVLVACLLVVLAMMMSGCSLALNVLTTRSQAGAGETVTQDLDVEGGGLRDNNLEATGLKPLGE